MATVGAGLAVGSAADAGRAYGSGSARAGCGDSLQALIGTALVAEQLATTFYYTALTTGELMADSQLGGSSTDPNHPGLPPNGNSGKVRFLQAALDAELKHANSLTKAGAHSTISRFFFPAGTLSPTCATGQICTLGTSDDPNTFLGVLDTLETAFVGAYLVAVREFVTRGYPQLVEVAANIVGVESEHRALGRVIADAEPSNNLTLERMPFACIGDAATALHPGLLRQEVPAWCHRRHLASGGRAGGPSDRQPADAHSGRLLMATTAHASQPQLPLAPSRRRLLQDAALVEIGLAGTVSRPARHMPRPPAQRASRRS